MTVKQHIPLAYFYVNYNTRGMILSWVSCKATKQSYEIRQMETTIMGQEICSSEFKNIITVDNKIQMCGRALYNNFSQITSWVNKSTNLITTESF